MTWLGGRKARRVLVKDEAAGAVPVRVAGTTPYASLEHRQSANCWCIPRVEQYEHADVVIHNDPKAKGGES